MFNNKSIFLTGGTGTFGTNFLKLLLKNNKFKRLVIFSRDELKQSQLQEIYSKDKYKKLRFFLGDIRDYGRLQKAMEGIDTVIHAAALKQVPAAEYNPYEFIKTNVIGTQNLIDVALEKNVEKFISLSTDKAASPSNLYGATKLCSDKLVCSANNYKGNNRTKFSVVRYGNVLGSRGSVVPLFLKQKKNNQTLTVTSKEMTRFNTSIDGAIEMIIMAHKRMHGGEIFVQKAKSYRLYDLAKFINKGKSIKVIGLRPGEKLHEEMISSTDSYYTYDCKKYFVICNPSVQNLAKKYSKFKKYKKGMSYNSLNNNFMTSKDFEVAIKMYFKNNRFK